MALFSERAYLRHISDISQAYLRHISGILYTYLKHISGIYQAYIMNISDISMTYIINVSDMSQTYQGKSQAYVRNISYLNTLTDSDILSIISMPQRNII